ncbi:MAG: vitamin B12-dependent ribonucleotide reductase [Desulfatibacillaceae bacterium]
MLDFLTKNSMVVLERRYLKKDDNGNPVETPEEMFRRVARAVAEGDLVFDKNAGVDALEREFFEVMGKGWFLPNSPTLMNAGRRLGQLSACFVLPVEDSIESIFDTLKHTAMIHKSGGGTGFSFSRVRPENDKVLSTAGVSSGPISFMQVFDTATETVKQGGARRGANMGILQVDHPDIMKFICAKDDPTVLNNFNISVGLTGDFMDALAANGDVNLINPRTAEPVDSVPARAVFDRLVQAAWKSGEPGVIFLDRMNEANPTPELGRIEATNPCGEQPLLPYESCTLGSVNLHRMVEDGDIAWDRLRDTVHTAVHFLDNVIEINRYALAEIEEMTKKTRKVGLGIMGYADMLIELGLTYDTEEAVELAEKVMGFIQAESKAASAKLAITRGNFPAYTGSVYDNEDTPHMRNATTTTVAPTGTISIIAGTSSGIEPVFAVAYTRRVLEGDRLAEMHPVFERMAREMGFHSEDLAERIIEKGSVQQVADVPVEVRRLFKTSHDMDPLWHVRVQAAFQKYTDNAVSKTVNFPAGATAEDVETAFVLAHESGCKGITVYRYGSREHQVLSYGKETEAAQTILPRSRPLQTTGVTERMKTGCGNLYVTVNQDDMGICEVFAQMGKTGGCASSQTEATGRLISLALRSGVKPEAIVKQIVGIRCPSPAWQNSKMVLSCPDAVAQVLQRCADMREGSSQSGVAGMCPDCGDPLRHAEGCLSCRACGYSKCS